jgi:hypothetical protein
LKKATKHPCSDKTLKPLTAVVSRWWFIICSQAIPELGQAGRNCIWTLPALPL